MLEFTKKELSGWGKYERIIFPLEILLIILISIYMNDNKVALVSAVCGICYTILAGKGKISCYFFGLEEERTIRQYSVFIYVSFITLS